MAFGHGSDAVWASSENDPGTKSPPTEGVQMRRAPLVITGRGGIRAVARPRAATTKQRRPRPVHRPRRRTTQADTTPQALRRSPRLSPATPSFRPCLRRFRPPGSARRCPGQGRHSTVFAPTDAAFAELPAGTLDTLLQPAEPGPARRAPDLPRGACRSFGRKRPGGTGDRRQPPRPSPLHSDGGNVAISDGQGNRANVIRTDIDASNGVIHAIDAVLLAAQS